MEIHHSQHQRRPKYQSQALQNQVGGNHILCFPPSLLTFLDYLFFLVASISGVGSGGAPACVPCPPGTEAIHFGTTSCKPCEKGYYSAGTGVFTCSLPHPPSSILTQFFFSIIYLEWLQARRSWLLCQHCGSPHSNSLRIGNRLKLGQN